MKYIFIILIFLSCNTEKKVIGICADKFIIKDSIVYVERYDTIYEAPIHDTTIFWNNRYINDTISIKKIRTINKYIDKIVYRENVARVVELNNENTILHKSKEALGVRVDKLESELQIYKIIRNTIISLFISILLLLFLLKKLPTKWL